MTAKATNIVKFGTPCGEYIEQFIEVQGQQSKNTAKAYRGDFRRFLKEWLNTDIESITIEELNKVDYDSIVSYRSSMAETLSNNTINRHFSSISAVLKHLKARNIVESDTTFLDSIKKLPAQPTEIEYMPHEALEQYINEAGKERNYPKLKQGIIKIAVECALRLDEALNLDISQFTVDGDVVVLKGYGKGNEPYYDKISIDFYREILSLTGFDMESSQGKMFKPLSTKNVTDMMTRIARNLKYEGRKYSFHSLKKTGVTAAYRVTGDILEAQRKGRHASLDTTRTYLKSEDYGVTGLFSMKAQDSELYKNVSHEELLKGIEELNKDFLHLLNAKLNELNK